MTYESFTSAEFDMLPYETVIITPEVINFTKYRSDGRIMTRVIYALDEQDYRNFVTGMQKSRYWELNDTYRYSDVTTAIQMATITVVGNNMTKTVTIEPLYPPAVSPEIRKILNVFRSAANLAEAN